MPLIWQAMQIPSQHAHFRAENEVIYAPAYYRAHAVLLEKFTCFSSITNSLQISRIDSLDRWGSRKTPDRYRMLVQGKREDPNDRALLVGACPTLS
jgi:hypothetical protein